MKLPILIRGLNFNGEDPPFAFVIMLLNERIYKMIFTNGGFLTFKI